MDFARDGDLQTEIDAARLLAYRAAWLLAGGCLHMRNGRSIFLTIYI